MCEKIPTGALSREEWLRLRKTGIGGSDAGAICGLNPYSSPMKVYLDKTSDTIEEVDSEAMRQGRDLENYVAMRFMEATGKRVRRSNVVYRSKENPFMIADVDRLVVGEDAGLECKTASAYNADKWKDGKIPLHYIIQCYHYMAVTGKKRWYIAVVILGVGFQYARLDWDEEMIRDLIQIERSYWKNYIEKRVLPEPDGSKSCNEVLDRYFHMAREKSPIILTDFTEKLERRVTLEEEIGKLELERNQIDQEIKLAMGEHEEAVSGRFTIRWANVSTVRLDTKRMKQEKPELYKAFARSSDSRRFTVRAA